MNTPTKQQTDLALTDTSWGAADDFDGNDFTLGKIYQQQALSQFVQDELASPGDWCDSITGEILAKKDETLPVIIFSGYKKLNIYTSDNGKDFDFKESQDITPENCNLPWLEEVNGETVKRQLQYNYFCILPSRIQDLPYVISFSSSKIKTARRLNAMIAKLGKRPSAAIVFELKSVKESGDKGSWYGVDIKQGRDTTLEELQIAKCWYDQIKAMPQPQAKEPEEKEMFLDEYLASKK